MKKLLLCLMIGLAGCTHLPGQVPPVLRPDARTEVLMVGLRTELQAAMSRGDRAKLEQLLDASFLFVHSTGKLESHSDFIERSTRRGTAIAFVGTDVLIKKGDTWRWVSVQSTRTDHG